MGLTKAEREALPPIANLQEAHALITEAYLRLRSIPKKYWTLGTWTDEMNRCCFVGHYTREISDNPLSYKRDNCEISAINSRVATAFNYVGMNIMGINDEPSIKYPQSHPKDRTMAACMDAIDQLCEQIKNENK